jgi:hypothetical protein
LNRGRNSIDQLQGRPLDRGEIMLPIFESDLNKYVALAIMALAILIGYLKGRSLGSASGRSLGWTGVPLIALAIASLGPSVLAVMMYFAYKFGLLQPEPAGYKFSTYIRDLPADFAVMNWPFVALYVTCRLRSNDGSTRFAMWSSVIAMVVPNVLLLFLAGTMVSNVYDAGQGIGIVLAMLNFPILAMVWPASLPSIVDGGISIGSVLSALTAPIPILGLMGWLVGRLFGTAPTFRETPGRP